MKSGLGRGWVWWDGEDMSFKVSQEWRRDASDGEPWLNRAGSGMSGGKRYLAPGPGSPRIVWVCQQISRPSWRAETLHSCEGRGQSRQLNELSG